MNSQINSIISTTMKRQNISNGLSFKIVIIMVPILFTQTFNLIIIKHLKLKIKLKITQINKKTNC